MKTDRVDLACLMCYLSKGDKITSIYQYPIYTIIDDFKYDEETKEYNYSNAEKKYLREHPEIPLDPTRNVSVHKKYLIPEIRQNAVIVGRIKDYFIQIGKNTYNFQKNNVEKLARQMASDIAAKYTADSKYRKYVNERVAKLEDYDFMGRKKEKLTENTNIGGWKIVKYLSTGLYGATYIVSKKGKEYVMKTFHTKSGKRSPKAVEKECNISKLAGELGVGPKVVDCEATKVPQYIVMEKLDGPNMSQKYKNVGILPKPDEKKLYKAISILDENKIKHNDLHLGNVMYHKDKIYIIDYGMANIVKSKVSNKIIGQK